MAKIGWKTKEQIEQEQQLLKTPFELLQEKVADLEKRIAVLEAKNV